MSKNSIFKDMNKKKYKTLFSHSLPLELWTKRTMSIRSKAILLLGDIFSKLNSLFDKILIVNKRLGAFLINNGMAL